MTKNRSQVAQIIPNATNKIKQSFFAENTAPLIHAKKNPEQTLIKHKNPATLSV